MGELRAISGRGDQETTAGRDREQRRRKQVPQPGLQVVPLTSKVERLYPSETYVMLNSKQSKAMANQLTTVSKGRLLDLAGRLSRADMEKVEHAIIMQLGLRL